MKFRTLPFLRFGALAAFFLSTLWLTFGVGDVFPSPDENANFRFAAEVATNNDLCIADPLALLAGGIVHPRSTVALYGCVVPGSFIGFPTLVGIISSWFGAWSMVLVTPFLALMTVILAWDVMRRLTKDVVTADIAALLLMSSPPFWYYTTRVMMHNVALVAFLTLSVWLLVVTRERKHLLAVACSGLAAGLAIFMRTFEASWIVLLGVAGLLVWPAYRHVKFLAAWIVACSLPVLCMPIF
ncbi:MAG: glycosyltransferase family 39 protein [Candidatus Uhrbacteria bacterium]|nr:glycosyltransferase family 39 protein [Candidatus Uhrbacteria bacterium]